MDDLGRWQRRLLPLMSGVIVVSALFFAAVSIFEFQSLRDWLERSTPPATVSWPAAGDANYDRALAVAIDHGSYDLEQGVIAQRYGQATAAVLARLWTRFMGFLTGMILAFVGAAFVLGKLSEAPTEIEGSAQGIKAAIATSSPGLVLAVLGTLLMTVSLTVTTSTAGEDRAVYFRFAGAVPASTGPAAPPLTTAQIAALAAQPKH